MKNIRTLCQVGFVVATMSALSAHAQVKPEIDPADPKPSELPAASGEAKPGRSIRPQPSGSVDPGTPQDRKMPQTSSDGEDGSQKSVIRTQLTSADQAFVTAASQIGKTEIDAGNIALQRSQNSAVKEFAQMMITEHSENYARLSGIAERDKVKIGTLDAKHSGVVDTLRSTPAADFDRIYVGKMVQGHQDALTTFQTMAKKSDDAEIKSYADDTVIAVQKHLDHVQKLQASMAAVSAK